MPYFSCEMVRLTACLWAGNAVPEVPRADAIPSLAAGVLYEVGTIELASKP